MAWRTRASLVVGIALLLGIAGSGQSATRPAARPLGSEMRAYNTTYYAVRTDVSEEMARETQLRVDRMFEEYAFRTAEFSRPPREKAPLYLFSRREDYNAAGGPAGTAGVFMGEVGRGGATGKLMGVARSDARTWHVLQHEGFHQFAFMSISTNLPIWVNEGLAEYFGEAAFTGDAFATGLVPESRRKQVVEMIEANTYMPMAQFAAISHEAWNDKVRIENYTQAWSMVHFLVHGENGKHQKSFAGYMMAVSRGARPDRAWAQQLGGAVGDASFEAAWKKYWKELPADSSAMVSAQARSMVLTSFLARAALNGKKFNTMEPFLQAARAGEIKMAEDPVRWLPVSLLEDTLKDDSLDAKDFTLKWAGNVPTLTQKVGESTITVIYKGSRTIATVKEPPATTKPKKAAEK